MTSDIGNTSRRLGAFFSEGKGLVFTATALFFSISAFVALSAGFRGYQADLSVLVIPKGKAVYRSTEIVDNVVFLSRTDGFRSLFFRDAESVPGLMTVEGADEMSGDEKRKTFDSMVSVFPTGTGSVFSVRAFSDNRDDAKDIARSAALSLFRYASKYYDVKEEADFRIVDGPTVAPKSLNGLLLLSGSVAFGTVFAAIVMLFLSGTPRVPSFFNRRKMPLSMIPFSADIFQPKRPVSPLISDSAVPDDIGRETEAVSEPVADTETAVMESGPSFGSEPVAIEETESLPAGCPVEAATVSVAKKAPAPLNIPTFSEEEERFLNEFTFETVDEEDVDHTDEDTKNDGAVTEAVSGPVPATTSDMKESVSDDGVSSPSRDEYRRRLNELLRG